MGMRFLSHANKTSIHVNGFALSLGLKRKLLRATRKWTFVWKRWLGGGTFY